MEATGTAYKESNEPKTLMKHVISCDKVGHPPHFAPPILEIQLESGASKTRKTETSQDVKSSSASSRSFYLSQTPAILAYLAPRLGLDGVAGEDQDGSEEEYEIRRAQVNQITLTILDLNNETHDSHHPVASSAYYEEQIPEAKKRAADLRKNRLPKFFGLFEATIAANEENRGKHQAHLFGSKLTTADLALFQLIDGLQFAFPKRMAALEKSGKYKGVFALKDTVAEVPQIKAYLESDRRLPYSSGVFRHYPELDGEE